MNQEHADRLRLGETVTFRPSGNSMKPVIFSKQKVTVEPIKIKDVGVGQVVFCRVKGRFLLHKVKKVGYKGCLICNNKGRENGWTKTVFGVVVNVED